MSIVYLIGEPGAGKSTLTRALAELLGETQAIYSKPFAHEIRGGVAILGKLDGEFSGTDRLGMGVQPRVIEWLKSYEGAVFGEGDRLGNKKFFQADHGHSVKVAWIDTPPEICEARRRSRAERLNKPLQSSKWVKGRCSKIRNLLSDIPVYRLDHERDTNELALEVCNLLRLTP